MAKSTAPPVFDIHVDGSCLTNSTDLGVSPKQRDTSDETVVHNPPEDKMDSTPAEDDRPTKDTHKDTDSRSALINERISAQIHEAARKVIADIEREHYDDQEDSLLSAQTDESYDGGEAELTGDGTEMTYEGTEATYESEQEEPLDTFEGESQLDAHLDEALTAWEPTKENENENAERDQDSSSHHDGDIDDDVFSEESGRSQRSSINSVHDLNSSDEAFQKALTSPAVGEEAATSHSSVTISRIPSTTSYVADESNLRTPSKILHRPPFRTPSSVRAMQMGSPTQSIFSSPRSAKRNLPIVSRSGTPTSQYSPSKRTPTRFKAPKEKPLVLLHVTLMPLQWPFAHTMTSRDIPESLQHVKESWGLLQDKLAHTVLERGILLSHPQDSYEVLEERLLEALELPVRPRAQILKCGHYMGPVDDLTSSDDEGAEVYFQQIPGTERKWCDICRKDVKLEETGETCGKKRFNVKIFAGNGLMRAGAWAAVWREMERVDVEIEPWVEINLRSELELLASNVPLEPVLEHEDDGFVDDEEEILQQGRGLELAVLSGQEPSAEEAEIRRKFEEEELAHKLREEQELNQKIEEEEMHRKFAEEEEVAQRQLMVEENLRRKLIDEEALRNRLIDEQRMREIYEHQQNLHRQEQEQQQRQHRAPKHVVDPDSLPELLVAAFKVLMRDKKNIAIGILSVLVLFLALRPTGEVQSLEQRVVMGDTLPRVVVGSEREVVYETARQVVKPAEVEVVEMVPAKVKAVQEAVQELTTEPTAQIVVESSTKNAEVLEEAVSEVPLVGVESIIEAPPASTELDNTPPTTTEEAKLAKDTTIPADSSIEKIDAKTVSSVINSTPEIDQAKPDFPTLEPAAENLSKEMSEKETTIESEGLDPKAIEDKISQAVQDDEQQKADTAARKLAAGSVHEPTTNTNPKSEQISAQDGSSEMAARSVHKSVPKANLDLKQDIAREETLKLAPEQRRAIEPEK